MFTSSQELRAIDGLPIHSQPHRIIALLEMAGEAESLQRYPQAEHLYKRALMVAYMYRADTDVQIMAILLDIVRVCEKQNRKKEAETFYHRACAIGSDTRKYSANLAA